MYKIKVHNRVYQIMSLFHVVGLWQDGNSSGFRKWFPRLINFTVCVYYPIGLIVASLLNENKIESVFQGIITTAAAVQIGRIYYFYLNKDQIFELVRTLGTHVFRKKELNQLYSDTNTKIKRFVDYASIFFFLVLCLWPLLIISTLMSNGRKLLLNLYFPWKENKIVYWFAFAFTSYTIWWLLILSMTNVIVWYLMMSCAMKYEILGNEFRLIGVVSPKECVNKQRTFAEDLIELTHNHQRLQDITAKFKATFSNLFFIQITTSGLNICGTVFALTFVSIDNPLIMVFYFVVALYFSFEIFMVTYFGNEIKLWSSRLSYCLFECDWFDQSKSSKQCTIILMEVLKRPQLLIIKWYPLDLEIFTKILKFTYSMFNVLMGFK